jgi:two-component sensor histidine kinase
MHDLLKPIHEQSLLRIAHGDSPGEILAEVCCEFERLVGCVAGVTILDPTAQIFQHGVFPSLSPEFGLALAGIEVADKPGSCALAVADGKTVVCEDVAGDNRFAEAWKKLSLQHGLRALISIPALRRDGVALGTFVVGYAPEAPLGVMQRELADEFAALCGLVLAYRQDQLKHELLVGELQHRARNLFATIGAVVYATLKSNPEPDQFRRTFDARLAALARAYSLALEAGQADLRQLVADTLAPYSLDNKFSLEGPTLQLTQDAAVAFSLATHELATNAAKYGALSQDGGSVRVRWAFDDDGSFEFTWSEAGGPPVGPPNRQGFGQRTLHRSMASAIDGKVSLDYRPEGLVCSITAPRSTRLGARVN